MKRSVALSRLAGLAALLTTVAPQLAGARAVTDPVAQAKARIEQSCLKVDYPDDFAKWGDLNGDGRDDVVITYTVTCDGFSGAFCGLEGCEGAVYVEDGLGGYVDAGLPPEVEATEWKGWPAVSIRTHGSNCGLSGPKACKSIRVWDGSAFVRPTNAMARSGPPDPTAPAGAGDDDSALPPLSGDEQAELQRALIADPAATRESVHRRILAERPTGLEPELETPEAVAPEQETVLASAGAPDGGRVERRFDAEGAPLEPETPEAAEAPEEPEAADDATIEPHSEEWVFLRRPGGGYAAEILGQDGASRLRFACAPGRPAFSVVFSPARANAARPGALVMVDFWVGRRISQSRLMAVEAGGVWRDSLQPYSRLIGDLRRGVWLVLSEPGSRAALAEFALSGSSKALGDLIAACRS